MNRIISKIVTSCEEFMMRMKKSFSGRKKLAYALAAVFMCVVCLYGPRQARAQWTQPDASNNIHSTNTGNAGVGTSTPQAKLDVEGSSPYSISGVFSAL